MCATSMPRCGFLSDPKLAGGIVEVPKHLVATSTTATAAAATTTLIAPTATAAAAPAAASAAALCQHGLPSAIH